VEWEWGRIGNICLIRETYPTNGRALHTQRIPVRRRVIRSDNKGKQSRRQMDALMPSIIEFGGKRCNSSDILPPKAHALQKSDIRWSEMRRFLFPHFWYKSQLKGIQVPKWNTNAIWLVAVVCFPCCYIFCLLKCRKCCRPHQEWASHPNPFRP